MRASLLRESFLHFFEKQAHVRAPSSSLVPANDPTLFFTNAGMVQFKEIFLGTEERPFPRACSSQKCIRVSGKHNDLESVGHTPRHHTFFEMLGNFSFGDYFKKEAIAFAWEFLTKELGLDKKRLCVTVFRDDDEAEHLWKKHVPQDRIFRCDEADNFWAMGDTGPCGPCSEIHWDFKSGPVTKNDIGSDRFMELWNLVFMQFNRTADGSMQTLASPSIDTGMGLERVAAVVQGVASNWETDLFVPLISAVEEATNHRSKESEQVRVALRVIADHLRCSAFLIADGVTPSNEGRGYVLRRIMRRAIRYGKRLGQDEPFLSKLVSTVTDTMGTAYPELLQHQQFVEKVVSSEEERFYETLDRGLTLIAEQVAKMEAQGQKVFSGDVVFKLYDTYGFPKDLTYDIAAERGFSIDEARFAKLMEESRALARKSWKGSGEERVDKVWQELVQQGIKTTFVGYGEETARSLVVAIVKDGTLQKRAAIGETISFVTTTTPFYGEGGGQVGDTGHAVGDDVDIRIVGTTKPLPGLYVHRGEIKKGSLALGDHVTLAIDSERRADIRRNHTATHLLHKALRSVLGEHVKQAGSLVEPQRLRFDFSHFQAMTPQELSDVEDMVNASILRNMTVTATEMPYDEALSRGALAFFGEKYGARVRLIEVSDFSRELCGGTHATATGEIGFLKILGESSVAAGVRRIEALTGRGALQHLAQLEDERTALAQAMKVQPSELVARVVKLVDQLKKMEQELRTAKTQALSEKMEDVLAAVHDIAGVQVLAARVELADSKELCALAERYQQKLKSGVVVLGSGSNGKATLVAMVSKDLVKRVNAGDIIKEISALVGGKGGGRPDIAQGGGADPSKLDAALLAVDGMVEKKLTS